MGPRPSLVSRRTVFAGAGAVWPGLLLAACTPTRPAASSSNGGGPTDDPFVPLKFTHEMLATFDARVGDAFAIIKELLPDQFCVTRRGYV